jgi:hypothetical protein
MGRIVAALVVGLVGLGALISFQLADKASEKVPLRDSLRIQKSQGSTLTTTISKSEKILNNGLQSVGQENEPDKKSRSSEGRFRSSISNQTGEDKNFGPQMDSHSSDTQSTAAADRPILLDPAIEARCKAVLRENNINECEEEYSLLLQLSEEPRDQSWSNKMEELIRNQVLNSEPGRYALRSLECRDPLYSQYRIDVRDLSFEEL